MTHRDQHVRPTEGSAAEGRWGGVLRWIADADAKGYLVWILMGLTGLAYAPTLGHQFTNWDDPIVLLDRSRIRSLSPSNLWEIWTQPHLADFFPVTETLYAIQYQIEGYDPAVFHAVSILLHMACAGLVFQLGRSLGLGAVGGACAGLVFGWHPIHVESAAWIADQKDLLACLFGVLSVSAFVAYHRAPSMQRHFVAFTLGLLAILAKPAAVTIGACVFVVHVSHLGTGARKALIRSAPLLFAGLLFSVIVVRMHQSAGNMKAGSFLGVGPALAHAAYGFAFPLWKFVWPYPLLPDYQVGPLSWSQPRVWGACLTVLVCGMVIWRCRGRSWIVLSIGWYAAAIAPVLRFVRVGNMTVADRYMYLPSVGLCLLAGVGIQALLEHRRVRDRRIAQMGVVGGTCGVLLVLPALSVSQMMIWKDSKSLWTYELNHRPDSPEALLNYGILLDKEGRYEESIRLFDRALELEPDSVNGLYNKGISLTRLGRLDEAMQTYTQLFSVFDEHASGHYNMANILANIDREDEAIYHFQRALEIAPGHLKARRELGSVLARMGRCREARGFLESVLRAVPADTDATVSLAICRVAAGEYAEADRLLREAFEANKSHAGLRIEIVWLWSTCPDEAIRKPKNGLKLAVQLEKAFQGRDRRVLDVLAAAQANNGQFERAVITARKALEAPIGQGGKVTEEAILERIRMYEENRPYRLSAPSKTRKGSRRIDPPAQKVGGDQ